METLIKVGRDDTHNKFESWLILPARMSACTLLCFESSERSSRRHECKNLQLSGFGHAGYGRRPQTKPSFSVLTSGAKRASLCIFKTIRMRILQRVLQLSRNMYAPSATYRITYSVLCSTRHPTHCAFQTIEEPSYHSRPCFGMFHIQLPYYHNHTNTYHKPMPDNYDTRMSTWYVVPSALEPPPAVKPCAATLALKGRACPVVFLNLVTATRHGRACRSSQSR